MEKKNLSIILASTGILLLIPLIAMQFTDEVNWSLFDFGIAAALLLVVGFVCEFVLRKLKTSKYKAPVIMAIIVMFLLVWAELGVGIFGTPFAGN